VASGSSEAAALGTVDSKGKMTAAFEKSTLDFMGSSADTVPQQSASVNVPIPKNIRELNLVCENMRISFFDLRLKAFGQYRSTCILAECSRYLS
jgi:hypothetical protein